MDLSVDIVVVNDDVIVCVEDHLTLWVQCQLTLAVVGAMGTESRYFALCKRKVSHRCAELFKLYVRGFGCPFDV